MRTGRWLVAVVLVAGCTSTATGPSTPSSEGPVEPSPSRSPTAGLPSASPTVDPLAEARRRLTDVEAAAATDPVELRVAVATAMRDDLDGLVDEAWEDRVLEGLPGWPVTTGRARIGADGAVELDVVIAAPPDDDGQLVLRWLPAAQALGNAVTSTTVAVDGASVEVETDAAGARLLVPVDPGEDHLVRVTATYTVPDRARIADDGSPAGYGLLARTDTATMLGHWLPLVALPSDDGPMQARGDVGAFPPAAFSLLVEHSGTLVTGGTERPCPTAADGCTWAQGIGVRDLSAVVLDDAVQAAADGVVVHAPAGAVARLDAVADEAAAGLTALDESLGPLPWPSVDVVAAPVSPGAAGMEFPGMVWVDPGAWPQAGAEFGSYVLAHELAHQWFHALVGNGSLSAPVVDESLAQYLSVVLFDRWFGDGAGDDLADRSLGGRHDRSVGQGVPDEAPAQPLAGFASAESYGANVYGRGGQAWVDAEDAAGRDDVLDALATLVARYGLRQVRPRAGPRRRA